tara:strand:+ start:1343 stop:1660 length:318 start_codon:yes stop_codon:yes gene_type:complete
MKIKEFKKLLENTFEKSRKTYDHKMNEYATDLDVFQSFKLGVGFSFQDTPEGVAWNYACKHFESIKNIISKVSDEVPTDELLDEKIGDAINYLIIIKGLIKERGD